MNPQQQNQFSTSLSPANFSTEHMPLATKRQIHKDSCDIFRAVVHKNMLENGMSLVTNTAMTNIANLCAWGFTPRSIYTWVKPRLGLCVYLRNSTEHLLLGTRGKAPIQFKGQMNWGFMPLQDHSHKPEEVYDIIERCSEGNYLELFARRPRHRWDIWGNEVASDVKIRDFPVPAYKVNAKDFIETERENE
ncbi:MAG: MT-A70 family methyltransferase [Streptococcus parauberis]